jgi:hypothetical protein
VIDVVLEVAAPRALYRSMEIMSKEVLLVLGIVPVASMLALELNGHSKKPKPRWELLAVALDPGDPDAAAGVTFADVSTNAALPATSSYCPS